MSYNITTPINTRQCALMIVLIAVMLLTTATAESASSNTSRGKLLFTNSGCKGCHTTARSNKIEGFSDFLSKKGPDLWFAGSKFKRNWLKAWLKSPIPIRPMEYNSLVNVNPDNHPALSAQEAEYMTSYLMTLTYKDGPKRIRQSKKNLKEGKIIFEKKGACYGCHMIRRENRSIGGLSGPSFIGAGKRLQSDWIYAFLKNPESLIPPMRMPKYNTKLTDKEIYNLTFYLETL